MNSQRVENLDKLIHKASQALTDTEQLLTNIINVPSQEESISPEEEARYFQLILEYRLNNQDALVALLNLDKHLLYILGIQPQHSAEVNLERIRYALGSDDLKEILHALNQLVDYLLRIAKRYQSQHTKEIHHAQKNSYAVRIIKEMKALLAKQAIFLETLHVLEKDMAEFLKLEAMGPIYDHIAALRGPISQFYQATWQGLELSRTLYGRVNKESTAHLGLDLIIKKAEHVLEQMPSLYQPQLNYSLGHFSPKTSQQLEERAAAKRLRPFF